MAQPRRLRRLAEVCFGDGECILSCGSRHRLAQQIAIRRKRAANLLQSPGSREPLTRLGIVPSTCRGADGLTYSLDLPLELLQEQVICGEDVRRDFVEGAFRHLPLLPIAQWQTRSHSTTILRPPPDASTAMRSCQPAYCRMRRPDVERTFSRAAR